MRCCSFFFFGWLLGKGILTLTWLGQLHYDKWPMVLQKKFVSIFNWWDSSTNDWNGIVFWRYIELRMGYVTSSNLGEFVVDHKSGISPCFCDIFNVHNIIYCKQKKEPKRWRWQGQQNTRTHWEDDNNNVIQFSYD